MDPDWSRSDHVTLAKLTGHSSGAYSCEVATEAGVVSARGEVTVAAKRKEDDDNNDAEDEAEGLSGFAAVGAHLGLGPIASAVVINFASTLLLHYAVIPGNRA